MEGKNNDKTLQLHDKLSSSFNASCTHLIFHAQTNMFLMAMALGMFDCKDIDQQCCKTKLRPPKTTTTTTNKTTTEGRRKKKKRKKRKTKKQKQQ